MEKGHYNRKLELWLDVVADSGILLQEPYFSETPGFFAVILVHSAYIYVPLKLCSQMFQHVSLSVVWFSSESVLC